MSNFIEYSSDELEQAFADWNSSGGCYAKCSDCVKSIDSSWYDLTKEMLWQLNRRL